MEEYIEMKHADTVPVVDTVPDGSSICARGLLDSGSTISFVSERLAQSLQLLKSPQQIRISAIAGTLPQFSTTLCCNV